MINKNLSSPRFWFLSLLAMFLFIFTSVVVTVVMVELGGAVPGTPAESLSDLAMLLSFVLFVLLIAFAELAVRLDAFTSDLVNRNRILYRGLWTIGFGIVILGVGFSELVAFRQSFITNASVAIAIGIVITFLGLRLKSRSKS